MRCAAIRDEREVVMPDTLTSFLIFRSRQQPRNSITEVVFKCDRRRPSPVVRQAGVKLLDAQCFSWQKNNDLDLTGISRVSA